MLAPKQHVRLTPTPGGGYDVEIIPPPLSGANFDQSFASYRAARGYAGGLKMTLGLPLIDLAKEGAG